MLLHTSQSDERRSRSNCYLRCCSSILGASWSVSWNGRPMPYVFFWATGWSTSCRHNTFWSWAYLMLELRNCCSREFLYSSSALALFIFCLCALAIGASSVSFLISESANYFLRSYIYVLSFNPFFSFFYVSVSGARRPSSSRGY